jgi:hypothetical protein
MTQSKKAKEQAMKKLVEKTIRDLDSVRDRLNAVITGNGTSEVLISMDAMDAAKAAASELAKVSLTVAGKLKA